MKVIGGGKVEGLWKLWDTPSLPECRCTGALRAVRERWRHFSPKPSVTVTVHFELRFRFLIETQEDACQYGTADTMPGATDGTR